MMATETCRRREGRQGIRCHSADQLLRGFVHQITGGKLHGDPKRGGKRRERIKKKGIIFVKIIFSQIVTA